MMQVTLPALKDSAHIAAVTLFAVVLAVTSLPVLLTAQRDAESAGTATVIRYAVGATAICLTLGVTVTFVFVPKVIVARRQYYRLTHDTVVSLIYLSPQSS